MRQHRYCVIMCGGVGSRFWPFSRANMPKQFLDFFGTGRSLLQMTVDRVSTLVDKDHIVLVTNEAYADMIREQLPDIKPSNILLEPARRNTAPCICWATHHIYALDKEASIMTLPSDHLILKEMAFVKAMDEGMTFVENNNGLLTLGIMPTSPETGYGYIQKGTKVDGSDDTMKVKSFTEKPNLEMAKMLIATGEFFWNSGIFLWKAQTILDAFQKHAPEIAAHFDMGLPYYGTDKEQQFINEEFVNSPSISVDYAIMEKADNVFVKTVDLGWSDLGTWKALYETSPRNIDGNVTQNCKLLSADCKGSVFAIKGDKVVVAVGLKDYIVAENGNALLICPLSDEQKVRQMVNDVKTRFGEDYV